MDHLASRRWLLWLLKISHTLSLVVCNSGFNFHVLSEEQHSVNRGDSLTMKCNTTLDSAVNWLFDSKDGLSNGKKIAHSGAVVHNRRHHFAVEHQSKGVYNLNLLIASLGDAGKFTCVEDDGFGPGTTVHHVTVVEPAVTTAFEIDSHQQQPQRHSTSLSSSDVRRNAGITLRPLMFFPWWLPLLAWWSTTAY